MATVTEVAFQVTDALFGPHAFVPWWAWLAVVAVIFWGLLAPAPEEQNE